MTNRWPAGAVLAWVVAACAWREPQPPPLISGESKTQELGRDSESGKPQASSPLLYTFGFESHDHQLWFHSGTDPQLYTVKSKDGKVLAAGIDDAMLRRDFPELYDLIHNAVDVNY